MPQEETKQPNTVETTQVPATEQPGAVLSVPEGVKAEDKPSNNGGNIERNIDGTIKKGTVLNPKGKPKGSRHLSTKLREYLKNLGKTKDGQNIAYEDAILRKLAEKAIAGDIKAIEMIFDRLEGKPTQPLSVVDPDEEEELSAEEKAKLDAAIGLIPKLEEPKEDEITNEPQGTDTKSV